MEFIGNSVQFRKRFRMRFHHFRNVRNIGVTTMSCAITRLCYNYIGHICYIFTMGWYGNWRSGVIRMGNRVWNADIEIPGRHMAGRGGWVRMRLVVFC